MESFLVQPFSDNAAVIRCAGFAGVGMVGAVEVNGTVVHIGNDRETLLPHGTIYAIPRECVAFVPDNSKRAYIETVSGDLMVATQLPNGRLKIEQAGMGDLGFVSLQVDWRDPSAPAMVAALAPVVARTYIPIVTTG